MKRVLLLTLLVISGTASAAWAQLGLYGSPEMVGLPPAPFADRFAAAAIDSPATSFLRPSSEGPPRYPRPMTAVRPTRLLSTDGPPRLERPGQVPPSVVDQLLEERGASLPEPSWAPDVRYGSWGGYGDAPDALAVDESCDPCGDLCGPCFQPRWYASASGLIMGRDKPNQLWTTYEDQNNPNQLPTETSLDWRGGGEVRFGRCFCCGTWALEAAYWTLDPFTGFASQTHPNGVSSTLEFMDVIWADPTIPGTPGDLFNGAEEHRVWREDEVHNVELNLIRNPVLCRCVQPLDVSWCLGVRYFRFDEELTIGSLRQGGVAFGIDPTLEGYLYDRIENNLVGAQIGCDLNYRQGNWRLFLAPRIGLYNNHIRHHFNGYRGDGELFDVAPAGYPSYPVNSSKDVISFLTQIDLGLAWQFAPRWSTHIGYRVVAATGIGLADHQIPPYVVDTPVLAKIDHNGNLLLHGAFAGLTFSF